MPAWLSHYASLEQGASKLHGYEPVTVPGLLQTRAYTAAVMRAHHVPVSDEDVTARVEARISRQAVFDRQPPLEFTCVIDESVLHRVTGGHDVMRAQLDHLCTMAAQPSISLRVLPLSCAAGHSAAFGSFDLFTSAGSPAPFMACAETLTGFSYSDSPTAIENYRLLFNHLYEKALPPSESANLIRTTSMEHYE